MTLVGACTVLFSDQYGGECVKFKEKVVFVTGGSRGIGREIVRMFAMEGATVLFTYNQSQAPATQLETELRELGAKVKTFAMDVTDYTRTISIMEEAIEQYGDIDILVNNAGITNDGF